jgi:hypothetical protein
VVALLNRRPTPSDRARRWPHSRGLLALEVARAPHHGAAAEAAMAAAPLPLPDGAARAALGHAWTRVGEAEFAPFSLVYASPDGCWLVSRDSGAAPRARVLVPGWHVLTHTDVDDPAEPRAASLARDLAGWSPRTRAEAVLGVLARLRRHAGAGGPSVCLHHGRMVTVSSSLVWLDGGAALHLHAEGRACETPYRDVSALAADDPGGET